MKVMPARSKSTPPQPSVLKLPLADAEAKLTGLIEDGRKLVDSDAAQLDSQLAGMAYGRFMTAPPGVEEVRALERKVGQWRDYNRTWLKMNLGGEAAEEYVTTSTHWHVGGSTSPKTELDFLRSEIEQEVSKLESIRGRLPMWAPPEEVTATSTPSSDSTATTFATNRKAG
jgi:hypothetical protein